MYSHLDKDEQILLRSKLKMNNTHPSYNNLIDGTVDLIICARESSEDEQNYALEKGVTLIEKPIANDSFAFLLNRANSVENLTHEQVVGIYTGQITNWKEVGGEDQNIKAFTLSLGVSDLLNQQRSLQRYVDAEFVEDRYSLVMGRFAMFSVKWNFGKMNPAKNGRVQDAMYNML